MDIQAGDILAFYGRGFISRAIEIATLGPSHVAQIAEDPHVGLVLWEATTLCELPDLYEGKQKNGVQAHDPFDRVRSYEGEIYRLRPTVLWKFNAADKVLQQWVCRTLHAATYDYEGAGLSGTRFIKRHWLPYPNFHAVFCSEFCVATLMRLSRPLAGNPRGYNPAGMVRAIQNCGAYGAPERLVA